MCFVDGMAILDYLFSSSSLYVCCDCSTGSTSNLVHVPIAGMECFMRSETIARALFTPGSE